MSNLSDLGIPNPESIFCCRIGSENETVPLTSDRTICALSASRMKILAGALLLLLVASSRCAEVRRLSAEELQRSDLWKDDSQRLLLFPEQGWRKLFDLFATICNSALGIRSTKLHPMTQEHIWLV